MRTTISASASASTRRRLSRQHDRLKAATDETGRDVSTFVLFMIIADETDEAARAKWEHYKAGADEEAIAWLGVQGAADTKSGADNQCPADGRFGLGREHQHGNARRSYETVARLLDEVASVPGTGGVLLTFDDFVEGVEAFGTRIQPQMTSRRTSPPSVRPPNERASRCRTPAPAADARERHLPARPEPLSLTLHETAVVVVDMQNAYATRRRLRGSRRLRHLGCRRHDRCDRQGPLGGARRRGSRGLLQNGWTRTTRTPAVPARPTGTSRTP